MTIRLAEPKDIPRVIDLLRQVGQVHHELRPDLFRAGAQKYDEAALQELLKDPTRPIFAAIVEGTLMGYCFCIHQVTKDNPVLCDRKNLYIDDLCVDEACRGQGIATALYRYALECAQHLGAHSLTLNVWCGNESAMRFYEKMGMKPRNIMMETKL